MTRIFNDTFGRYVVSGDTISAEVDGFEITATLHHDEDAEAPWEREDGHGPVTDWTRRSKAPGEIILSTDRESHRFYDFAEACAIARRDGWGVAGGRKDGESARAYAARAALADFRALRAWANDEWHYVGVAVTVERDGIALTGPYDFALWGIESNYPGSDNDYLAEVAEQFAPEALDAARAKAADIAAKWSA